jgi:hypothetical protein
MHHSKYVPPYDTGKVKVGLHYQPPSKSYVTSEGEQTQRLLLGVKRSEFKQNIGWAIYFATIYLAAVSVLIILGG